MADLLKIKNNVRKMVDMGAPETDIDQYLSEEGTTPDEIRNFKGQPKETIGQMLVKNLKGAYAESLAPVVHGASTLASGIPKAVAERTGTKAGLRLLPKIAEEGNIDLSNRPILYNSDGTWSTEKSFSFRDEYGKEVLIPSIINGKEVGQKEAIQHYYKTGEHLGKFNTVEEADNAAKRIHSRFGNTDISSQNSNADIAKIRRNVIKLRDAGVPDNEIDQYISEEDSTPDEIRGFKEQPKETIGQMLVKNLKGAYVESLAPVVHGASTLAFGIPKAVAERTGTKELIYPEQTTLEGKINRGIMEGLGFMGGGTLELGTKAGLKLLPKIAKEGLKRKALRAAATFGIAGATQIPEKSFIQPISETGTQLAAQAGTGAILGAAGEAIGAGGVKLGRKIKETKTKIKTGKPLEIRTAGIQRKLEESAAPGIEKTKQLQQRLTKSEELLKEKGQQEIEGLKRDVVKMSELETQKAKPEVKALSRRFSESYGKKLEAMPDVTRGEANTIITEAENAAKAENLDTNILSRIREDYKIEPPQTQNTLFGTQTIKEGTDPNELIPFKKFKQSIDRVKREMSAGSRGAKLQFTPDDDIVANILFDKFGDYHSVNIPEFAKLQAQYKPLLQAIKEAHKTFKPGAMYDLTSGSKFLQDISGIEPKTGPRQIAKILMGGHPEFGEGIPGFGSGTKKATELLTGKEQNLEQSLARIKQIKELATNKEQMLKDALAKRQEIISRQAEKVRTLQYRKKLGIKEGVKRAARKVAVGGAVAAGGYLVGRGQ